MKVAVLLSGGVDSSVALRLLKDEGHDLTAFYLKIWLEDELSYLGECPWEEDLAYARQVCDDIGVALEVVSMQKEYWDRVVSYTIAECKAGRTPNPDIFCNQQIKFGQFYDKIDSSFDRVATGHYAQVLEKEGLFWLRQAPDPIKDQTYFLSHLSQQQLSRALFPIGKYQKEEVRQLAEKYNLPNKARKDSQGICFLGKIPYREFIKEHLGENPGDFIYQETGERVGQHKGHWFYTIGQRMGLGLSGGPWFVIDKDSDKNIIYLANGYCPEEVYKKDFSAENINWVSRAPEENELDLQIKIRHGAKMHEASVKFSEDFKKADIQLKAPAHGVSPGQFAVFYKEGFCLGGGRIM